MKLHPKARQYVDMLQKESRKAPTLKMMDEFLRLQEQEQWDQIRASRFYTEFGPAYCRTLEFLNYDGLLH